MTRQLKADGESEEEQEIYEAILAKNKQYQSELNNKYKGQMAALGVNASQAAGYLKVQMAVKQMQQKQVQEQQEKMQGKQN